MAVLLAFFLGFVFLMAGAIVLGAIGALPVMWLTNYVAPALGLGINLDFWHAWALMALCGILFKTTVTNKS